MDARNVGAGPNFSLAHRGLESNDLDDDVDDDGNRFDFGDTDFEPGFNFFAGARTQNGMFVEMKSTAYGVSSIRLMVGYNFGRQSEAKGGHGGHAGAPFASKR